MYPFATVVLLGLALASVVSLFTLGRQTSRRTRLFLDLGLGLAVTWITDYSMFRGWGVEFRSLWMGTVGTGLVIGGLAVLWHEAIALVGSYGRRPSEEAGPVQAHVSDRAA